MKRGRTETSPWPARFYDGGIDINIPLDLTVEILKKLPAKSLVRFQCVSKLWSSIINRRRDFIDSIVDRSLSQPPCDVHLISDVTSGEHKECFLAFSSSNTNCARNTEKVTVVSIPEKLWQYVRGLICCWLEIRNEAAIYNPTTRQTLYLPEPKPLDMASCFFGYDPIGNRYKALYLPLNHMKEACQVFTLGDTQWRTIQGVRYHFPMASVVCINGVIYYVANNAEDDTTHKYKLMSFDVRSEKFIHVEAPKTLKDTYSPLINYQGKLGFVYCENAIGIWVMDEKQEWSRIFFYEIEGFRKWRIFGATRGGEIVFVDWFYLPGDMLYVLYYDPKRNSVRYVDLKGTYPEERRRYMSTTIWTVLDHVENTMCLHHTTF